VSKLRSGMSVTVDIDTRRRRGLGSLFGNDVANAKDGE
jgi:multidrug efflux pump subunit AcrA (membrane-fusion protein)